MSGWIPVTDEHLPLLNRKVLILVTFEGEEEPFYLFGWLTSIDRYRRLGLLDQDPGGDTIWLSDDALFDGEPIEPPYHVVAWMPLPEVPEWLSTSIRISKTQ